jgi:hypothetical protein
MLQLHAPKSGSQLDFFRGPDAAVSNCKTQCLVESGPVSLVDGIDQFRRIS